MEDPDVDEYVFCDECRDFVYEYCAIHGPLLVLPDDKVPSPTGFPDFVPYAALTIPQEFLHLAPSNIPGAGIGVFATLTLPKGVRFGPYRGVRTKDADSEYRWQIYSSSDGGLRPSHAVDAADAGRSNWMRYVNCSRHSAEQNLLAYQYQGELYYRTIKLVPRFSELLVFYGAEFARSLRVDLKLYDRVEGLQILIVAPPVKRRKLMTSDTGKKPISDVPAPACTEREFSKSSSDVVANRVIESIPTPKKCKISPSYDNEISETNIKNGTTSETKVATRPLNINDSNSCNICKYQTYKKDVLQSHLKAHSASQKFICDICSFITTTRRYIIKHLIIHSGEKPYACDICDKRFIQNSTLIEHKSTHTGIKPYVCDICDKRFTRNRNLSRHMITHAGIKPYVCDICEKRFTENSKLTIHKRTHTGEKPYACNICDIRFTQNSTLVQHKRRHTGEKPFTCDICDKRFTDIGSLTRHKRIHTGEKPYACDICDKKFRQNSHLSRHMIIHAGIKPYACDICDKRFTENSKLTAHKRTHTGEKPYVCDLCDERFTVNCKLTIHKRTHTEVKLYACDNCDKRFTDIGKLTRHKRTHTGKKPYICNECAMKYSDKRYLIKHIKNHH